MTTQPQGHEASNRPLLCPRCRVDLVTGEVPVGLLHGCKRCGGVFLGKTAADRLNDALCDRTLALADSLADQPQGRSVGAGPAVCPMCQAAMQVTHCEGIELDVCLKHGTWFDPFELSRLARALAAKRAYGRHNAAALAGSAVGTAGIAVGAAAAQDPNVWQRARQVAQDHGETAVDAAEVGLELGSSLGDMADVAEGASAVSEGAFAILAALFEV